MPNQPRTDIHRPTDLVTEDYAYVGGFDNDGADWNGRRRALVALIQASTTTRYASGHQCDHCGAHIRYVGVIRHLPTGDHLAIGETCLDNRFSQATADFQRMRKTAQLDRQRAGLRSAWADWQTANPADWDALKASTNPFVVDVLRKGSRYGNLTARQFDAIVSAVARDAARVARQATVAIAEPTASVPEGNAVIEGLVLSLKECEGYMPGTTSTKMLVKVATGAGSYRIFGTVPASIYNVTTGDRVTFTAKVQPSGDDQGFGFFSRPRKATIVEQAVAA